VRQAPARREETVPLGGERDEDGACSAEVGAGEGVPLAEFAHDPLPDREVRLDRATPSTDPSLSV